MKVVVINGTLKYDGDTYEVGDEVNMRKDAAEPVLGTAILKKEDYKKLKAKEKKDPPKQEKIETIEDSEDG